MEEALYLICQSGILYTLPLLILIRCSGPYPLFWVNKCALIFLIYTLLTTDLSQAILALYENPANNLTAPTNVTGSMLKTPITPVDSSTVFSLTFSAARLAAQAALSCSITLNAPEPGVIIRFERGSILISAPIYCPKEYKVQYLGKDGKIEREEKKVFKYTGGGWHFQADEVARCVRDGKKESALWGHDKSLLEMTVFDEVWESYVLRILIFGFWELIKSCRCEYRFVVKVDIASLHASKRSPNKLKGVFFEIETRCIGQGIAYMNVSICRLLKVVGSPGFSPF